MVRRWMPTVPTSWGISAPNTAWLELSSVSRTSSIDRMRSSPGEEVKEYGSRSSASRRSSAYTSASAGVRRLIILRLCSEKQSKMAEALEPEGLVQPPRGHVVLTGKEKQTIEAMKAVRVMHERDHHVRAQPRAAMIGQREDAEDLRDGVVHGSDADQRHKAFTFKRTPPVAKRNRSHEGGLA